MRFNSLALRLILLSACWSIVSLLVVGLFMGELYKDNARDNFYDLLDAHLYNVISSTDISSDGHVINGVNLGDPRFKEPYSGWYWTIFAADERDAKPAKSTSLVDEALQFPDENTEIFDDKFHRKYLLEGINQQQLIVVERKLYLDDSERLYHVVVTGNAAELEREAADYQNVTYMILGLLALASIISTLLIVIIGLRPLKQVPIAFEKIINGDEDRLTGKFPSEIQPLVNSTNDLISSNSKIVERARTQVGNLAHALKTPLSVLLNEARSSKSGLSHLVLEQTSRMQEQIQHYLDRARISAQRENFSAQCDAGEVLERLVRVMIRLHPNLDFDLRLEPEQGLIFRGEQQDLEELAGNLIENATKFAQSSVIISAEHLTANSSNLRGKEFKLIIKDDGAGLSDDEIKQVMKRGERLDETKPGSGLGLSIVKDIVDAYEGDFQLKPCKDGGLEATIYLSGFVKS